MVSLLFTLPRAENTIKNTMLRNFFKISPVDPLPTFWHRGIRTLSHAVLRLAMSPNAV
jgi:hypothetical protein